MSTRYLSVIPAYGRDYKNKEEVLKDWANGKDFLIQDMFESGYINKDNKPANVVLNVRYYRLRKVCVIR